MASVQNGTTFELLNDYYVTITGTGGIVSNAMLNKGSVALSYVKYNKSNTELTEIVDSAIDGGYICENLVDDSHIIKGFVSIGATSGSGAFSGLDTVRSVWFKAKKNTTYTLVSDKSMNRRVIHECSNIPTIGASQTWTNIAYDTVTQTDKRLTFTTNNADFNYVVVYYTNENVDMYVQVVEGTQTDIIPSNKTLAEQLMPLKNGWQTLYSYGAETLASNNRDVFIQNLTSYDEIMIVGFSGGDYKTEVLIPKALYDVEIAWSDFSTTTYYSSGTAKIGSNNYATFYARKKSTNWQNNADGVYKVLGRKN